VNALDQIRQRWTAWRARGRSRDGFFRLVCRGFDDVLAAGGGRVPATDPGQLLFLDADFAVRTTRASDPDFARLNQTVAALGVFAAESPLHSTEQDETWSYTLALIAEKTLAWLSMNEPSRPELLLALGRIKAVLHKPEEAEELYGEARKRWESQSKRMRRTGKHAAI
jgi:hypothetical protein